MCYHYQYYYHDDYYCLVDVAWGWTNGQDPGNWFVSDFSENTLYKVRVNDQLVNFFGTAATAGQVSEFTTSTQDLKITELISVQFTNDTPWVEIYNGTTFIKRVVLSRNNNLMFTFPTQNFTDLISSRWRIQ